MEEVEDVHELMMMLVDVLDTVPMVEEEAVLVAEEEAVPTVEAEVVLVAEAEAVEMEALEM